MLLRKPRWLLRLSETECPNQLFSAFAGFVVIFACLGLGEAVYRLLFLDFDGATDRLPAEMAFGLMFAWIATKLAKRLWQHRIDTMATLRLISARNYRIRNAVDAIVPITHPGQHQAIRVIREQVEHIERVLVENIP